MIKIIILFIFLWSTLAFGMKGVVLTLETPLFESPDTKAPISQYVRKGAVIYIHNQHDVDSPNRPNYFQSDDSLADFTFYADSSDFYKTLDRRGVDAYILKKHVKLIYNDQRELSQKISPFKYDPTDYRPEEPLPENYPFLERAKKRALFALMFCTPTQAYYNYPSAITNQDFGNRIGITFNLTRKASWDNKDRFYFGLSYQMSSQLDKFSLRSNINSQESIKEIGLGPIVSYDLYRFDSFTLTTQWSLLPIAIFHSIDQINSDGDSAKASFIAFNFKTKFSILLEKHKFLPSTSLILGSDLAFKLPHTIVAQNQDSEFWNTGSDQFKYPFEIELGFLVGLQTKF